MVAGRASPKRGRRTSRAYPRVLSACPIRPGVECSWCRTIRTGRDMGDDRRGESRNASPTGLESDFKGLSYAAGANLGRLRIPPPLAGEGKGGGTRRKPRRSALGDPTRLASLATLPLAGLGRGGIGAASPGRPGARHAPAQLDALARGNPQQVGGAPDDVVLELVGGPVRIGGFPHHLDDAPAPFLVERAIDQVGEMIEVDRLAVRRDRGVEQLGGARLVEVEAIFEDVVQAVALGLRQVAVDRA